MIGNVLMLNPGSAKLQAENFQNNSPTHGEIIIDPTMESLIKLVEGLYKEAENLEGRLYIYNLFPLQNPQSNDAVKNFELLWNQNEELVKSFPKRKEFLLNQFQKSPWILVGWGCGKSTDNLDLLKKQWLKLIKESGIPIIGKRGKEELSFYHPKPQIKSKELEYREEIKKQYDKLFNNEVLKKHKKIEEHNENIYGVKKANEKEKIIDELLEKRIKSITDNIREFEDRYEYFFITDYEEKYSDFEVHAIPLYDIQVVLLEVGEKIQLVSIEFSKSDFDIEQIVAWIQYKGVYFGNKEKANHTIERYGKVLEGIKFKGNVIVAYISGNKSETLDINDYDEITKKYTAKLDKVDTTKSKKLQNGLSINFNGELVNEVPRIDFQQNNDMIISNGNLINADYIDEYNAGIGIYRYEDEFIPVVSFVDTNTTVYIDLYEKEDGSQVCIIEHKYIFDIEVL